jgi:hypothetical protein
VKCVKNYKKTYSGSSKCGVSFVPYSIWNTVRTEENKMYDILPYTYKKAKALGVSIKPSRNHNKKIDVFKKGRKVASVGGARLRGLSDLS